MAIAMPSVNYRNQLALGRLLQCALAAASVGAALVHLEAARDHSSEPGQWALVLGAIAAAAGQLAWAGLIMRSVWQRRLFAGILFNLVLIGGWALSRTVGLPVPGGSVEPLGFKDGIAVLLETAIIGGAGLLAVIPRTGRALPVRAGRLASGAVVLSVAALTLAAVVFASDHGTAATRPDSPEAATAKP